MSDFATTYGADYLTLNPDIVFGTAMLGRQFGAVKGAALKRTGLREEIITDAGELVMLLIKNPGWELMMTCAFDRNVSAPGLLEEITMPFLGIKGRVMDGASITWDSGSERVIMIPVSSWDSMAAATAWRISGTGERLPIGRAGIAPVQAPTLAVIGSTSTSITLAIGLVTGAEKYRVEWKLPAATTWELVTTTTANFATKTGLDPLMSVQFRVRAEDGEAAGPWSAPLTASTTAADAVPATAPVPSLQHTAGGITMSWPKVAQAQRYEIEVRGPAIGVSFDSLPWTALHDVDALTAFCPISVTGWESMTLSSRQAHFTRQYRIRAVNSVGAGAWRQFTTTWLGRVRMQLTPVNRELRHTFAVAFDDWGPAAAMPKIMRVSRYFDMRDAVELDFFFDTLTWPATNTAPLPGALYPQTAPYYTDLFVPAFWENYTPGFYFGQPGDVFYVQLKSANTRLGSAVGSEFIREASDWGPITTAQLHPGRILRLEENYNATPPGTHVVSWATPAGSFDGYYLRGPSGIVQVKVPDATDPAGYRLESKIPMGWTSVDLLRGINPTSISTLRITSVLNGLESPDSAVLATS